MKRWTRQFLPALALIALCHTVSAAAVNPQDRKDVILSCDFEDAEWWRVWGLKGEPANCALVEGDTVLGGKGKSLKVTIPKGASTGANFHFRFQPQLGHEPEEIYFRYYLKLDPDWKNARDGGKLPGFSATYGKSGWGGRKVDGTDGWSSRGHFKKPGPDATEIGYYCYHADMKSKYGDVLKFNPPLQYDRWYCIEMHCKLNSLGKEGEPGKKDGILRAWIDGKLAYARSDLRFRDVAKLKIESIWINVYHGGTKRAPQDLHCYLDNITIAHKPIGPAQADRQEAPDKKTALAQLAAKMKAGEWAELKTEKLVDTLRAKGASGAIFGYNEDAVWDPKTCQFYFVGGDHNDIVCFVTYVDDTNSWKIMPKPDWVGKGTSHGYSHHGFDAERGLLYYFPFGNKARTIHRYDIAKSVWSTVPKLDPPEYLTCCVGVEYFPELDGLVIANGGGGTGSVYLFQEKTQKWTTLAHDLPMGIYHNTAQYSPMHKIVLFGGGNGSSDLYKLDAKGKVTTLKKTPIGIGVMQSILTVDPVSGDFLLFGKNGSFFVYDIANDIWKQQDSERIPLFSPTRVKDNKIWHVTATPISTYGVTLFVKYYHADPPRAWVYLYKHSDGPKRH